MNLLQLTQPMLLVTMLNLFNSPALAICEQLVPQSPDLRKKAVVCKTSKSDEIIFCFEGGVHRAAEKSIQTSSPVQARYRFNNVIVSTSFQFAAYGTEPGMYEGTSSNIFLQLDAWGPSSVQLFDGPKKKSVTKGSCVLKTAFESDFDIWTGIRERDWEGVETYVSKQKNLKGIRSNLRNSLLSEVVEAGGPISLIESLIARGADVHDTKQIGSPLMAIIPAKSVDYILKLTALLLKHGANINDTDRMGLTLFMGQVISNRNTPIERLTILKSLLGLGANPNSVDNNGENAFFLSFTAGRDETEAPTILAKELISLGVDPKLRNKKGLTFLEELKMTKAQYFPKLIKFLESL